METRKVQVPGGSTYTVSVPRDWAIDHEVSAGSVVALYSETDTLVLRPRIESEPSETDPERATRLADEAGDANAAVGERARALDARLRATDAEGVVGLGLVVDSLSRVADYGGNVTEVARQRAAPRP